MGSLWPDSTSNLGTVLLRITTSCLRKQIGLLWNTISIHSSLSKRCRGDFCSQPFSGLPSWLTADNLGCRMFFRDSVTKCATGNILFLFAGKSIFWVVEIETESAAMVSVSAADSLFEGGLSLGFRLLSHCVLYWICSIAFFLLFLCLICLNRNISPRHPQFPICSSVLNFIFSLIFSSFIAAVSSHSYNPFPPIPPSILLLPSSLPTTCCISVYSSTSHFTNLFSIPASLQVESCIQGWQQISWVETQWFSGVWEAAPPWGPRMTRNYSTVG